MSGWTVLLASLAGSLHCAAMCGGFAVAVSAGDERRAGTWRWWSYALGRLLGYLGLAALAGSLGHGLDWIGTFVGVQRAAAWLTGLTLIGLGLRSLVREAAPRAGGPALVTLGRRRRSWFVRLLRGPGLLAAAGVGLASAWLPCGWLWSFVLAAAGSGSPTQAATVMTAFWLGTLPALGSVHGLGRWSGRWLGPHAPRLAAAVMIALGVVALAGRWPALALAEDGPATAPPLAPCHAP